MAKLSEVSQELTFKISFEQAARFQNFFEDFDENMHEVGIQSYGISMTSLEEVFFEVSGSMNDQEKTLADHEDTEFQDGEDG